MTTWAALLYSVAVFKTPVRVRTGVTTLGQYHIMEQVLSPKDFVPRESVEKAGILDVFPFFHTAQLGQKIRRKPQSPPSGVALDRH